MKFFAHVLAAALAAAPVALAGVKVDCWNSWDCDADGVEGAVLTRETGCKLPEVAVYDFSQNPPLDLSVYPISYVMGLGPAFCGNRKHASDLSTAIDYCFEIGAMSACEWLATGCVCVPNPNGWGDPHFRSWGGESFDFHGACDLVFLDAPAASTTIHVRTTHRFDYSYISSAVIRVGDDVLEVAGWGEYFLNGVESAAIPETFGGKPFTYTMVDQKNHLFEIQTHEGERIILKSFKDLVSVNPRVSPKHGFSNSTGILGSAATGQLLARDHKTVIKDPIEFGQEWQVLESEAKLFQNNRAPQNPEKCVMPEPMTGEVTRRLGETIARDQAEKACSQWGLNKEACIYDVMATGDLDMAEAGAF